MRPSSDIAHLAGLLIEQFGDHAAAEIVQRVRDCRRAGDDAQAGQWLAILDAVFAEQEKAAAQDEDQATAERNQIA